ncbi:hypothetical protein LP421_34140 (plasmid) [Rhizobium sp. RCAM05350]|nr:hypothetical protein LP421_34140 [Rhizobium sp. RCAM05350]
MLAAGGAALAASMLPRDTLAASIEKGGTLKAATITPATALDPFAVSEDGGRLLISQPGEYLAISRRDGTLKPVLAESWAPATVARYGSTRSGKACCFTMEAL